MNADEIVALSRRYTLDDWQAQANANPIPVDRAEGYTGDPRRWPNEPGVPGVIHLLDPYHGPDRPIDTAEESLR